MGLEEVQNGMDNCKCSTCHLPWLLVLPIPDLHCVRWWWGVVQNTAGSLWPHHPMTYSLKNIWQCPIEMSHSFWNCPLTLFPALTGIAGYYDNSNPYFLHLTFWHFFLCPSDFFCYCSVTCVTTALWEMWKQLMLHRLIWLQELGDYLLRTHHFKGWETYSHLSLL